MNSEHVSFQIDDLIDERPDCVVREGKIFEAGDYPERSFTLSVPELEEAVADFRPVPLKLQHVDTPLDGKLGTLESLHMAGPALIGRVRLPRWLDRLIPDKRVSCAWDRASKRLAELSLVTEPRIADAVLYAANAEDRRASANLATLSIPLHFDHIKETPITMNFNEWLARLRALFSVLPPDESTADYVRDTPGDEREQLRTQLESLKATQRQVEAAAFADSEIRARRAYPAERGPLIAAFTQAACDDDRLPDLARFGDGTPASRIDALKALLAARPPHTLTEELLDPNRAAKALFHEQKTGAEINVETRRAELLSQTHMGREILKSEKGK